MERRQKHKAVYGIAISFSQLSMSVAKMKKSLRIRHDCLSEIKGVFSKQDFPLGKRSSIHEGHDLFVFLSLT